MPEPPKEGVRLDMSEHLVYQKLEEVTGIHIEFVHPSSPETPRQLQLLLKADNLPDILEWTWRWAYPGGPDAAIDDGMILPLNDLIMQHAPNLLQILSEDEKVMRSVTSESGRLYVFPGLDREPEARVQSGLMIRRDWLEQLGASVPTTIDGWWDLLVAMRNTDFDSPGEGREYPFFFPVFGNFGTGEVYYYFLEESNAFAGSWGVSHGMLRNETGDVEYGPVRSGYRDMLIELHRWYESDLIHPWLAGGGSGSGFFDLIVKSGASIGSYDFLSYLQPIDLVLAPSPTLVDNSVPVGSELRTAYTGWGSAAVSASSVYAVEAVKWLDVAYSDWGRHLFNYGIEDETYTFQKGKPVLADAILTSYDSSLEKTSEYASKLMNCSRILFGGPFETSGDLLKELRRGYLESRSSKDPNPWLVGAREPPDAILSFDTSRRNRYGPLMDDIRRHARANFAAFITGQRPLEEFDQYVREIENLGLHDAIALISAAEKDFYKKPVF